VVTVDGVPAVATGVDDRGQLLVQRGGAIFPITSGDVVFSTTDTVALTTS
jgi:biotin-(acetyl-CoA carboxylase) ligase